MSNIINWVVADLITSYYITACLSLLPKEYLPGIFNVFTLSTKVALFRKQKGSICVIITFVTVRLSLFHNETLFLL